ncbi:MAG: HAMP domain-containing protein [Planctomycetes bacterium]|nr:HAMP domain-containing protein [Planctomycetota bacterium]
MRLPRGFFFKLVLIFLVIGLVPLAVVSISAWSQARRGMTETATRYWLLRTARETAALLDGAVDDMRALVRSWADDDSLAADLLATSEPGAAGTDAATRLRRFLDNRRRYRPDLDALIFVARDGTIVAQSTTTATGSTDPQRRLEGLPLATVLVASEEREWIERALAPGTKALASAQVPVSSRDWHHSPLMRAARGTSAQALPAPPAVSDCEVGFASSVLAEDRRQVTGVLVAIFDWAHIQGALDDVGRRFREEDDPEDGGRRYSSGYPFMFARDRDTIIAHHNKVLLGSSLVTDHKLESLHAAMATVRAGVHAYEYPAGIGKISGFAHLKGPEVGGFGWVVGVGINSAQVFAEVDSLGTFLLWAALITAGLVIVLAAVFSHRLTQPLRRLMEHTERVAQGDLHTKLDLKRNDELAVLSNAFNRMTADLERSRVALVEAEKSAAWREMARQVAHEIKNPLTPIMLGAQQIRQAGRDRHPELQAIVDANVLAILDQCEHLRRIAADFGAFAGAAKREVKAHELAPLLQQLLTPYLGGKTGAVQCTFEDRLPRSATVQADAKEMQRLILNLLNNALEACGPRGGKIRVLAEVGDDAEHVRISVSDTGQGLTPEAMQRLFEPYFSTRTGGTGLGLALCRRIVEDHGGTIHCSDSSAAGTTFRVELPLLRSS